MCAPTRRTVLAAALALPVAIPAGSEARPAKAPAVLRAAPPPLPVVLLDPGHGGKDPGAIGVSGTYEKHIALAAAEALQRRLLQGGRCRALLTRGRDVFIPLPDRVAIAQARGAALFVSMHADAINDPSVRGASVYTLSDTASDPQAAALARRENSADRFGGPAYRNLPPAIANILGSLARREARAGSVRMARGVVHAFEPQVGLLPNPARSAAFTVLRSADIPSVLVEMGFMSNPNDEAALRRKDHRERIAAALASAVERYLGSPVTGPHLAG